MGWTKERKAQWGGGTCRGTGEWRCGCGGEVSGCLGEFHTENNKEMVKVLSDGWAFLFYIFFALQLLSLL